MKAIKTWKEQMAPNTTLGEQLVLMQCEIDSLRAALAQPESEPASDREALITQLRGFADSFGAAFMNGICSKAADMLEADAREVERWKLLAELNEKLVELVKLQHKREQRLSQQEQVAVPPTHQQLAQGAFIPQVTGFGAVPSGYVLVPIEPTGEMWSASRSEFIRYAQRYEDAKTADAASIVGDIAGADIYRAMLKAAPQPAAYVPLSDEQAKKLCSVGPVYAPGGVVSRSPHSYRVELEQAMLTGFRIGEAVRSKSCASHN